MTDANMGSCIVVVRSQDLVNNPNGHIYNVYFVNNNFWGRDISLNVGATACNSASVPIVTKVSSGSDHRLLTRTSIPLASSSDSSVATAYKGPSVSRVPIYKVNGNFWTVTFDTYIGDVSPLSMEPTSFLSSGVTLTSINDVVKGDEPLSHDFMDIQTGIEYYTRVHAYTRGVGRGYGPYATSAPNLAATLPSIREFSNIPVIDVPEIQELILAATHLVEIQNVTTTATSYNDIQEIVIKSNENAHVLC